MKIGDIILIPFPYAEMNNIKLRPAVVITETAEGKNCRMIVSYFSKATFNYD